MPWAGKGVRKLKSWRDFLDNNLLVPGKLRVLLLAFTNEDSARESLNQLLAARNLESVEFGELPFSKRNDACERFLRH